MPSLTAIAYRAHTMSHPGRAIDRFFTPFDAERTDELGFLAPDRSPRLCRASDLVTEPITWVVGPPWLGKSTAAAQLLGSLRSTRSPVPGLGERATLTRLDSAGSEREVPPLWWADWVRAELPQPAAWLVDGVEEVLGTRDHLLDALAEVVEGIPVAHLRELRLVLFSRPYAELDSFRVRLQDCAAAATGRTRLPHYWLTRLDRASAAELVGPDRFSAVEDLIRRNELHSVAGYPIVLNYLKAYHREVGRLCVLDVWRGVLTALLGEPESHRRLDLTSSPEERFGAACRIAAVLTLTGREGLRRRSPDRTGRGHDRGPIPGAGQPEADRGPGGVRVRPVHPLRGPAHVPVRAAQRARLADRVRPHRGTSLGSAIRTRRSGRSALGRYA